MSKTIWKFTLTGPRTVVSMPIGAKILATQVQHEGSPKGHAPQIWAMCDPAETQFEDRKFVIVGTGHQTDMTVDEYVGTVQMPSGLVWHVFEDLGEGDSTDG